MRRLFKTDSAIEKFTQHVPP